MNAEISPKPAPDDSVDRTGGVVQFPGFSIDFDRGELQVGGRPVPLRPKTFAVLACLASQPGRLLAKDHLMRAVWPDVIVTDDSLVQCIGELRTALGPGQHSLVRTVPRRGYMLDAQPVAEAPRPSAQAESRAALPNGPSARRRVALTAGVVAAALLLAWGAWQLRPDEPGSISERRSLAVLPFENLSGDPAQQFFVEGISADVLADLSRLPDTLVIAQPSAQRSSEPQPRASGRRVPRYIVSGGVLRSGDDLRIQVRLSSSDDHAVLFSDTLVYGPDRPWNWRQDIAPRVAHALDIRLMDVAGGWRPQAPQPREAVEHTLRGYSLLRRAVLRSEFEKAGAEFASALQSDPASASAWAGLSMSRSGMILMRYVPEPTAMLREAEDAALRALELDASVPNGHYAHGQVLLLRGRLDAALEAFQRSLRFNPSLTFAHVRVAIILIELGRASESIEHARMALRRSPYDASLVPLAHFAAGMALFHLGRDDEAYAEMQMMVAADPRVGFAYQWMAAIDALHGRPERASENLAQYRKLITIQTIQGLKATERSRNPVFLAQRERFYDGLRRAGLPER